MSLKKEIENRTTDISMEIEAIFIDWALTHVSFDLGYTEPLTPTHLLHGHRIMSLPHKNVEEQDLNDPTYGNITDISQIAQLQAFLLNQF